MDAIESCESPYWELYAFRNLARGPDVNLRNLVRGDGALVLDVHLDVDSAVGGFGNVEAGVAESGVAEPVAEGEERRNVLLVEPAVPHVDSFAVNGLLLGRFLASLRMFWIGCGIVFEALTPGDWQASGGAGFAKQDIGSRPSALVARPPHLKNGIDLVHPRQCDWLVGVQDNDSIGVYSVNRLNELVLIARKAKDGLEAGPQKDHSNLRMSC